LEKSNDKNNITKIKKPRKRNYINNRQMFDSLVLYLNACDKAEAAGEELPVIPRYLGECFLQIAQKLSTKANFSGYPFIEEMRSDGVINCVKYIRNFNPEYTNPFAYFTQYIKNAFLQRIESEKKNLYIRYKVYQDLQILEQINGIEEIGATQWNKNRNSVSSRPAGGPELNDISNDFIKAFEERILKNKKSYQAKAVSNTVTEFFEAEDKK
jgi:hypothetical protein